MKPFFFLLLLIASGILVAILNRPVELLAAAARSLGRWPDRLQPKRRVASLHLGAAGSSFAGDGWRPAAQF
jgi:hypothetical protein